MSLLVAMPLILSLTVATTLGTLLGNLILLLIIGTQAKRQQQKQLEEVQRLQSEFLEMRQKEIERMQRYATMEG